MKLSYITYLLETVDAINSLYIVNIFLLVTGDDYESQDFYTVTVSFHLSY